MSANQEGLLSLAEMGFAPLIEHHHGRAGSQALRSLMKVLRQLYRRYQPSRDNPRIVVFQFVSGATYPMAGPPSPLLEMADVLQWAGQPIAMEITEDGTLLVWPSLATVDLAELSHYAVVYSLDGGKESFWAVGQQSELPQIYPGAPSMFAIPTFGVLADALRHYRAAVVRVCQCEILKQSWRDDNRLFFNSRPERFMRRSLVQYLRACLRNDADVYPEQNVDESHPIDIRVTFEFTSGVALIEIKWLGKSVGAGDNPTVTTYTEHRAREGAKQLAEYLDWSHASAPQKDTRGYLVIIDGRRRYPKSYSASIGREDAFHFDHLEIDYHPRFHDLRDDFEIPIRMFAEPLWS